MNLPASEQDKTRIIKYLQMTREYARECENMVDTLKRLQVGDNKVIKKLVRQADQSTKLANKISEFLRLGKDTYPKILNENLVEAMTDFVTLSKNYMKMREGFDELLTAPESYIASYIADKKNIPHEGIEKLSKDDKQDLIMLYMRGEKNLENPGGRQWSNQAIGFFFNMKANTVVNRLTIFKKKLHWLFPSYSE